jgi:hypothetical protein
MTTLDPVRRRLALIMPGAAVLALGAFDATLMLKSRSERAALRHAGLDIVFAAITSPNSEAIRCLLSANPGLVRLTNSS